MMNRQGILLLAALCITGGQAHAGLFSDDEARKQVQELSGRVSTLEEADKQQAELNQQQSAAIQQSETIRNSLIDMQSQLDALNAELRSLRGQNEELIHGLKDAEKRQQDFYIDLDTRLRRLESLGGEMGIPLGPASSVSQTTAPAEVVDDPAVENRAYETAFRLFKNASYDDAIASFKSFLQKYPESVHIPNVHYAMGSIYFARKDYADALNSYQQLVAKYSYSPKTPDAMLNVADCQEQLGDKAAAKGTLEQIVNKYAGTESASMASKRLGNFK